MTPRWRATWAAVTRPASSAPAITRSASRYSWAAADRSRGSWRRGMASGYGTAPGRRAAPRPARRRAIAEPDQPGDDEQDAPRADAGAGRRRRPRRVADRISAAGDRRDEQRDERGDRGRATASRGTSSRTRPGAATCERPDRAGRPTRSQVAANRPQPVISPTSQPRPRAIGSQPMTARATRPRSAAGPRVGQRSAEVGRGARRGRAAAVGRRMRRAAVGGRGASRAPRRAARLGARRRPASRRRRCGVPSGAVASASAPVRPSRCRARLGGRAERPRRRPASAGRRSSAATRRPAVRARAAARRARAWYSGPCLRGSAYSFGLIVQYVPLVVPYQLAPPQSGSNGPASAPSYEVEPSVALPRRRVPARRRPPAPAPLRRPPRRPAGRRRRPAPARRAGAAGRPGRLGVPAAPADRRAPPGRRPGAAAPPAVGPARGVRPRPGRRPTAAAAPARPARRRRPARPADELLVRRLDREEPRQRRLAGRVGVVGLGQPPIRALDLVERCAARQAERAVGIGVEGHRSPMVARRRVDVGRTGQPISSPTGASSNSATASAPTRPCGSSDRRPVVASELAQRAAVEDAGLAERLDRGRPGPAIVAVAVLDLDRQPGRRRARCVPIRGAGQDRDAAQRLHPGLADEPARGGLHQRGVEPVVPAADHLRVGEHRVADRRSAARPSSRARVAGRDRRRDRRASRRRGRPRAAGRRRSRCRSRRSRSAACSGVVPNAARDGRRDRRPATGGSASSSRRIPAA